MKLWLPTALAALTMLTTAARADQCAWISKDTAEKAKTFVKPGDKVMELCEPCGDKTPKETKVNAVSVEPADKDYFELQINKAGVDLAYVFVKQGSRWGNLGKLTSCGAKDVSEWLPKPP